MEGADNLWSLLNDYHKAHKEDLDKAKKKKKDDKETQRTKKFTFTPSFWPDIEKVDVSEALLLEIARRYVREEVTYNHLAELFMIDFVKSFRMFSSMSVNRLQIGLNTLREAVRL